IEAATANLGQELLIGGIRQAKSHQPQRTRSFHGLRIVSLHLDDFLRGCLPIGPLDDARFRAQERIAGRTALREKIGTPVDIAVAGLGGDLAHESLVLVDEEAAYPDAIDGHGRSSLRGKIGLDGCVADVLPMAMIAAPERDISLLVTTGAWPRRG